MFHETLYVGINKNICTSQRHESHDIVCLYYYCIFVAAFMKCIFVITHSIFVLF